MTVLLLLMLWLLQRRRWFPALLVFVLAAHVKLTVIMRRRLAAWTFARAQTPGW